jgi:hypothetical protein
MCNAFSCLVTKDKVYWKVGVDSHDALEKEFNLNPPKTDKYREDDTEIFARVEIVPNNGEKYPYLYPELDWKFKLDEDIKPIWFTNKQEKMALEAHKQWKDIIYQFNYKETRNPFNPLNVRKHKPTKSDLLLLKEWDSVGDSVRDSVWDSVWDSVGVSVWASVGASVGDSVGVSVGSLFPNIKVWKYCKQSDKYPYQPCVDLWQHGLIPSFDGKVWRLHSGKNADIVFEISKEELQKLK